MPDTRTVVANAAHAVALDNGRHLHPGEIAEVVVTPRLQHLIDERLLVVVPRPKSPAPLVPSKSEED